MFRFIAFALTMIAAAFSPVSSYAKTTCGPASKELSEFISAMKEAIAIRKDVKGEYPELNGSVTESEVLDLSCKIEKQLNTAIHLIEPFLDSSNKKIHHHAKKTIKSFRAQIDKVKEKNKKKKADL